MGGDTTGQDSFVNLCFDVSPWPLPQAQGNAKKLEHKMRKLKRHSWTKSKINILGPELEQKGKAVKTAEATG